MRPAYRSDRRQKAPRAWAAPDIVRRSAATMRARIGACSPRSVCRKASGNGPDGRGRATASRIRKSSAVSGSGTGGGGAASKISGSRNRASSACSLAGIDPTCSPSVRVISAAFQSPPRARQKTLAGSVGDSAGFWRRAAHGASARSSRRPTSNQRRKSSGVSGPARSISAPASSRAPISSSRSIRATSTDDPPGSPSGGSVSARSSLWKSARASGTPCPASDSIASRTWTAVSGPQSALAKPVASGGKESYCVATDVTEGRHRYGIGPRPRHRRRAAAASGAGACCQSRCSATTTVLHCAARRPGREGR